MNSTRDISEVSLRHTLVMLLCSSGVCTAMLLARFAFVHNLQFRFSGLFGNLLLAWIPLLLTLGIRRVGMRGGGFWGLFAAWVLFFPNAFYIVTDLIHMKKFGTDGVYKWYDMLMTASFAMSGLFVGTLSLYLLHLGVRERLGWKWGWVFASGMLGLGAFGIFLGRFLRLNSWDVAVRPWKLLADLASLLHPVQAKEAAAFSGAFFAFSLATYLVLVSLARLPHPATVQTDGKTHAQSNG